MVRSVIVPMALLALASAADAGVVVTVGDDIVGHLFEPGATVRMNVDLTQDPGGSDIGIRALQFDLTQTAATLGAADFAFDFSDVTLGAMFYSTLPSLPRPETLFLNAAPTNPQSLGMLVLPAVDSARLAWFDVTLPTEVGSYVIDVVNGEETDPNLGFTMRFGFGGIHPITTWRVDTGEAFGGTGAFIPAPGGTHFMYVPEPVSLVLLAIGGLAMVRRRTR